MDGGVDEGLEVSVHNLVVHDPTYFLRNEYRRIRSCRRTLCTIHDSIVLSSKRIEFTRNFSNEMKKYGTMT